MINILKASKKSNYSKLLAHAGFELRKSSPEKASMGNIRLTLISYTGKNRVANATSKGSAAYEAGIDIGDYILKIGDTNLTGTVKLEQIMAQYKPGQNVPVTFEHKGVVKTAVLKLQQTNSLEVVPMENASPQQIKFRNDWLSSKVKNEDQ